MPKKKGGKGKKGKKKKKTKMVGNETPLQVVKRFYKTYERNCAATDTLICPTLKHALKASIEDEKLLTKLIMEPVPATSSEDATVSIEPLITALRLERYTQVYEFYIWNLPLNHENMASLALLLEKGIYPVKHLELLDCLIEARPIARLALSFNPCVTLSTIVLDYNDFGDEGCAGVCAGLQGNRFVISLSMCYCDLGVRSGRLLGHILSNTAVRELYVDGNNLECEGTVEMIKFCADHAEHEAAVREEEERLKEEEELLAAQLAKENRHVVHSGMESDTEGKDKKKKKGKKKKKKKEPPPPPPVGPWIYKLHLADNGLDSLGSGGYLATLVCMRLLRRLITNSTCLQELDLEDNLIGDLGGLELVEALKDRKDANLPSVKMRTTHRMNTDTLNTIIKLGVALKKKKKKGKKKKKK